MTPVRLILFTGKGGVGKTTTAAATALRLADRGTKTLLVSTDAAHSIGDAFGVQLTDDPSMIEPGLWAVQLSTQQRFEASWRSIQNYLVSLLSRGGLDPIAAEELAVLPGVEEVVALLAVHNLVERGDWDAVVLDCAPTAETVRLLALPEALRWYLDRALPAHRLLARGMRPVAAVLGRSEALPPDGVFAALLQLREQLTAVQVLLSDPKRTSVRLVLTPEAVVVAEARRTYTALSLYGYSVDAVIANRIFPAGRDAWRSGWVRAQREQLDQLGDSFAGRPVLKVPYRAGEPIGAGALRDVAGDLFGDLPGPDPAAVASSTAPLRVEAVEGGEYLLRMALPNCQPADVEAARTGDELVLTVSGHRRVLALPGVLRRCDVRSGRVRDGELVIRFVPDPEQWPSAVVEPR